MTSDGLLEKVKKKRKKKLLVTKEQMAQRGDCTEYMNKETEKERQGGVSLRSVQNFGPLILYDPLHVIDLQIEI